MNCKKCGLPIKWVRNNDKLECKNLDDSDHWDRCAQTVFHDVIKHGKPFTDIRGKEIYRGYESDKHGKKNVSIEGTWKTGKGYRIESHTCNTPPWEVCECIK